MLKLKTRLSMFVHPLTTGQIAKMEGTKHALSDKPLNSFFMASFRNTRYFNQMRDNHSNGELFSYENFGDSFDIHWLHYPVLDALSLGLTVNEFWIVSS